MCEFRSECATTLYHAEEADRLTKHLLPMHIVQVADELLSQLYPAPSTPLRSAQNDSTTDH